MAKQIILLVLLILLIAAPAQAATWFDEFTVDSRQYYNYTPQGDIWRWDTVNGNLYYFINGSTYYYLTLPYNASIQQFDQFSHGYYSTDIQIGSVGTGRSSGYIFSADTNQSFGAWTTFGNKYHVYLTSRPTTSSASLYNVVAGSQSLVGFANLTDTVGVLNTTGFHKVEVFWNSSGGIDVSVDGIPSISKIDTTFSEGYAGLARHGTSSISNQRYDNFRVNESAVANIASCTMTAPTEVQCTQDGDNYDDPGVTSTWVWGDGATSTGTTGTHTYSAPGYYTVSLILTNVAGSSSDTCINCADVSALPWAQVISPSVDYHPDCPWWRFGIACDHLIKLTV